jgi:hypothetical protein
MNPCPECGLPAEQQSYGGMLGRGDVPVKPDLNETVRLMCQEGHKWTRRRAEIQNRDGQPTPKAG